MSATVVITVAGNDITSSVLFSSFSVESQMAAIPGTIDITVKDPTQSLDFVTGAEVTVSVDGTTLFGGYITQVSRKFAVPVDVTTTPSAVKTRQWNLRGVDYNILFDKLVLRNTSDYAHFIPKAGPAPITDATVISSHLSTYLDLPAGFNLSADVVAVRTYDSSNNNPNGFTWPTQGTYWRKTMEDMAQWGAVYYLAANKHLVFKPVEDVNAHWGFSDVPDNLAIPVGYATTPSRGMREFTTIEDGSFLVNDALIWGGSEWANGLVFARKQNATSQTAHGRWQLAELHFGERGYALQAGVDQRANVIVTGKLDGGTYGTAGRGYALPMFQIRCVWFDHNVPTDPNQGGAKSHLRPGDLVPFTLYVLGNGGAYTITLPLRSVRISASNLDHAGKAILRFEGFFGVQLSDPWWLWRYLRNKLGRTSSVFAVATNSSTDVAYGSYGTFTPSPVPNGTNKVFTIPFGYIGGTTQLFINGLAKTPGADYAETDPVAGEITTTVAPASSAILLVTCRTLAS